MSQAVLDGVRDLLPTLRERADEAERLRVVPEASIKELEETGFFRLLQPKRFDGLEADPVDFYTAVRDDRQRVRLDRLGRPRGRRAPLAGRAVRRRGPAGRSGAPTPRPGCRSSYAPTGKASPDRRRLHAQRASGASPPAATTASGCCSAGWSSTPRARSSTSARSWCRASDYTIVDVWDMVGLRGTGSNDIVVERRVRPRGVHAVAWATPAAASAPARSRTPPTLYKLPFHSIFTGTITTPIIGMATGAYDEHVEMQQKRTRAAYLGEKASLTTRSPPSASPAPPARSTPPGRCWCNNIREEQAYVAKGEKIPLQLRLQVRRDQVLGSRARHRRDRLAVRDLRRPGADQRHLPPAGLARRARRPGARGQRPRARAADVRRPRVRPQDRPRDVLTWTF